MQPKFVGRRAELDVLRRLLDEVERDGHGRFVLVRGRRQVGKSRLVQELLQRSDVPSAFFTATREDEARELVRFTEALAASNLPVAASVRQGVRPTSWEAALTLAASDLEGPVILVLDEFPYLLDARQRLAATLQAVWDRRLSAVPVLLVVVGSDLSVMESLGAYGSPLYGRPSRELVIEPLGVGEIGNFFDIGTWIIAILGALLLLAVYRAVAGKRVGAGRA